MLRLGLLFQITKGSNEGHLQVSPAPSSEMDNRRPPLFMRFCCSASNVVGKLSIPSAQTDGGTILKGFIGRARCVEMWVAKGL